MPFLKFINKTKDKFYTINTKSIQHRKTGLTIS